MTDDTRKSRAILRTATTSQAKPRAGALPTLGNTDNDLHPLMRVLARAAMRQNLQGQAGAPENQCP